MRVSRTRTGSSLLLDNATLTAFVATAHPARAKAFYEQILGLPLLGDDKFALVFDCQGTQLRVQKVDHVQPQPFTVLGWQVPDIRHTMARLARLGVVFERFAFLRQDAFGVWASPSGAQVAWFKDPDGNVLSLTQLRTA